uniref:Dopamine receptor 4 n=1 Tax=Ascaris suum TaxID=6253 RepID=F1LDV9_ASCSU
MQIINGDTLCRRSLFQHWLNQLFTVTPLLRPEYSLSFNTSGIFRHRPNSNVLSTASRQNAHEIDRTASMITVMPNDKHTVESVPSTPVTTAKKKLGVREKSRQMMKYVHEQRAARTLSIVVGVFIVCWKPFFIFSPIDTLCETCISSHEVVFSVITWAGHLNSMLNPFIYSRFSREFRRAFKQILTCERERRIKTAIRTPLGIVFAQLVSVTQLWEQPNECTSSAPPLTSSPLFHLLSLKSTLLSRR